MLYSCVKDDEDSVEAMQFTMPFSQIVDLEGIDERYNCSVQADVISCETEPRSDGDGNSKIAECTLSILITCSAYRTANVDLAVDEYSTSYKTDSTRSDIRIELPSQSVNSSAVIKSSIDYGDGGIDCIYDVWCSVGNVNARPDPENARIVINGNAVYTVMARNADGIPIMLEKEEPFTANVPAENITEMSVADIKLTPVSCSYNLASDSSIEAKTEIRITGEIENSMNIKGITEISVDENEPVNRNCSYALKLYFTDDNEDLWEIAKKYGTSVSAIMEENDIEDDTVSGKGMILIPIV